MLKKELTEEKANEFLLYFFRQLPAVANQYASIVLREDKGLEIRFKPGTSDEDIRQYNRLHKHWRAEYGYIDSEPDFVYVFMPYRIQAIEINVVEIKEIRSITDNTCEITLNDGSKDKFIYINENAESFSKRVFIF